MRDIKVGDLVFFNGDNEACKVVGVDYDKEKLDIDAGDECIYIWDFSEVQSIYREVK